APGHARGPDRRVWIPLGGYRHPSGRPTRGASARGGNEGASARRHPSAGGRRGGAVGGGSGLSGSARGAPVRERDGMDLGLDRLESWRGSAPCFLPAGFLGSANVAVISEWNDVSRDGLPLVVSAP